MPRVSTKTESDTPKRAPRRQVVRRATRPKVKDVVPAIGIDDKEREREVEVSPKRKAPTQIGNTSKKFNLTKVSKRKVLVSSFIVAGFVGAFFIGSSDVGQIDVNSKITERNNQIASGINTEDSADGGSQVIPVQNTAQPPSVPNAGLKGRGVGTASVAQPVKEPAVDENATSTATSTDGVSLDDEVSNEEEISEDGEGVDEGS